MLKILEVAGVVYFASYNMMDACFDVHKGPNKVFVGEAGTLKEAKRIAKQDGLSAK